MKQRSTRQFAATWEVLAAATDHPTVEQIHERVRGRLPHVSLGTVYRNLEKLRELGRVRVVRPAGGGARYDPMVPPHDHIFCEACGKVADLAPVSSRLELRTLEQSGWIVRSQSVALYGLCADCARLSATATKAQVR